MQKYFLASLQTEDLEKQKNVEKIVLGKSHSAENHLPSMLVNAVPS